MNRKLGTSIIGSLLLWPLEPHWAGWNSIQISRLDVRDSSIWTIMCFPGTWSWKKKSRVAPWSGMWMSKWPLNLLHNGHPTGSYWILLHLWKYGTCTWNTDFVFDICLYNKLSFTKPDVFKMWGTCYCWTVTPFTNKDWVKLSLNGSNLRHQQRFKVCWLCFIEENI